MTARKPTWGLLSVLLGLALGVANLIAYFLDGHDLNLAAGVGCLVVTPFLLREALGA